MKCHLPVVHQYSVLDEVEDVVKVGQVSNVDNLSSGGRKKRKEFKHAAKKKQKTESFVHLMKCLLGMHHSQAELNTEGIKP